VLLTLTQISPKRKFRHLLSREKIRTEKVQHSSFIRRPASSKFEEFSEVCNPLGFNQRRRGARKRSRHCPKYSQRRARVPSSPAPRRYPALTLALDPAPPEIRTAGSGNVVTHSNDP
jgi:hypothetical protein